MGFNAHEYFEEYLKVCLSNFTVFSVKELTDLNELECRLNKLLVNGIGYSLSYIKNCGKSFSSIKAKETKFLNGINLLEFFIMYNDCNHNLHFLKQFFITSTDDKNILITLCIDEQTKHFSNFLTNGSVNLQYLVNGDNILFRTTEININNNYQVVFTSFTNLEINTLLLETYEEICPYEDNDNYLSVVCVDKYKNNFDNYRNDVEMILELLKNRYGKLKFIYFDTMVQSIQSYPLNNDINILGKYSPDLIWDVLVYKLNRIVESINIALKNDVKILHSSKKKEKIKNIIEALQSCFSNDINN